jgi:hypothetical protein
LPWEEDGTSSSYSYLLRGRGDGDAGGSHPRAPPVHSQGPEPDHTENACQRKAHSCQRRRPHCAHKGAKDASSDQHATTPHCRTRICSGIPTFQSRGAVAVAPAVCTFMHTMAPSVPRLNVRAALAGSPFAGDRGQAGVLGAALDPVGPKSRNGRNPSRLMDDYSQVARQRLACWVGASGYLVGAGRRGRGGRGSFASLPVAPPSSCPCCRWLEPCV